MNRTKPDIQEGDLFGQLKVLYLVENSKYKTDGTPQLISEYAYCCECECGKSVIVTRRALLHGRKSCGCLLTKRKLNSYRYLTEDIIEVEYSNIENEYFLIDAEDEWVLKTYTWYKNKGYPKAVSLEEKKRTSIKLSRLLMGFPEKPYVVDHINRNKNDNRKQNLRIVTQKVNARNNSSCRTKTGYRGVTETANGKYMARILLEGVSKSLGVFATPRRSP